MYILALKTSNPESEIYLYKDDLLIDKYIWLADRKLADTLNYQINEIISTNHLAYEDIGGLAIFKGPGSFTGLRIGISVFNAMAYMLKIPIAGVSGDSWLESAISNLLKGKNDKLVIPEYGSEPNITKPKK